MIDIDAIRKRDADWRHDGKQSNRNLASLDRRTLLAYIDDLEEIIEEIGTNVQLIKVLHREHYRAIPLEPMPPAALDAADAELAKERAAAGRKGNASFLASRYPGKLPP
jgi:hypothetical protein